MTIAIRLPWILRSRLEAVSRAWFTIEDEPPVDFARPVGEEGLVPPHSISWIIFKNPVALYIGGIAAVLLELSEPAVRAGVWQHSQFNADPVRRLRRTGLAAMITVYGARSIAEPMIARIARMHSRIGGVSAEGIAYSASDAHLLTWVHATAAYGFAAAYSQYVDALDSAQLGRYYLEGSKAGSLYGATQAPQSDEEMRAFICSMNTRLDASPIIFRFLQIMREAPTLPKNLRWMQPGLIRAAVDLIPNWIRFRLGLDERYGPSQTDRMLARAACSVAHRVVLHDSPAVRSCIRLGLPADYLYR